MEEAPRRDFSDDKHGLTSPDLCCLLPELAPPKFTIQSDDKHGCSIALFSLPDVEWLKDGSIFVIEAVTAICEAKM
ncbi:hypothetical protein YC2023_017964 [Brassica napus]